MKSIPATERPYEKCAQKGTSYLSDAELLSVILRSGSVGENALTLARRILYDPQSGQQEGLGRIADGHLQQWTHIRGIGKVKATQLVCLAELARRMARASSCGQNSFHSPQEAAASYMEEMRHLNQEIVKVVFLDTKTNRLGECDISKGTVNASLISPREIYMEAVRRDAVFIVVLHNHPSGDPTPSQADIDLTERIEYAGMMLGIPLLDHIVIGDRCYFSFDEHDMLTLKRNDSNRR